MSEQTERSTEEPTEETEREPSKEEYVCSVCGELVVPEVFETDRGKRYKCPACGKFMKPLTPEEAEKREEEEKGPLPPPEIEMTERVKELLGRELPRVYGIPKKEGSKRIDAILDTLSPTVVADPWNLHNHIKNFAPNADDRHLESIINKVFWELEEEGYTPRDEEYQPRYGRRRPRRGYQPRYAPLGERRPRRYYDEEFEGDSEDYEPRRQRRPMMKVVVDGQEIETDFEGYMAHQRYKREQAEEKRRDQEHELMMKKLDAEIKKITAETGGGGSKEGETLIPVKVGDQEIKVPASIAHLYLKRDDKELKDLEDKLDKEREERLKERDQRHQAEMKRLEEKIDSQPSFLEQLDYIQKAGGVLGLKQSGRTTIDLLSDLGERADARAAQILNKLPTPGGEFKPEVARTPEERRKKAAEIKRSLEKSEEILAAEDDLIRAASRVKS